MQKIANATKKKKKRNPLRFRPVNIVLQSMSSKTVPTPRQIPPYSINKSHRRRGVLHTPLQLAQNQSCENYIGHRKNYVLCRKNYIRHNSNYIRPFFAACKHMKNNSLQNHILIEQLFINQVVVKPPHSSPQIVVNTPGIKSAHSPLQRAATALRMPSSADESFWFFLAVCIL